MYDLVTNDRFSFRGVVDELFQVNIHLDVYVWNKSVYKEIKELFPELLEAIRLEGFLAAYTITPNKKFVSCMYSDIKELGQRYANGTEYNILLFNFKEG